MFNDQLKMIKYLRSLGDCFSNNTLTFSVINMPSKGKFWKVLNSCLVLRRCLGKTFRNTASEASSFDVSAFRT